MQGKEPSSPIRATTKAGSMPFAVWYSGSSMAPAIVLLLALSGLEETILSPPLGVLGLQRLEGLAKHADVKVVQAAGNHELKQHQAEGTPGCDIHGDPQSGFCGQIRR